jgi:ATP-dependent DNA helicase RecG
MLDSVINNITMEQLSIRFDIPLALVSPDELYQNAESFIEVLKEDRRFERKSSKASPRLLGEYLSMWANTAPDGGLIAVGIEDKGKVLGCKGLTQTELNEREQAGKIYCPDARPESKLVPVTNADGENDYVLSSESHTDRTESCTTAKAMHGSG